MASELTCVLYRDGKQSGTVYIELEEDHAGIRRGQFKFWYGVSMHGTELGCALEVEGVQVPVVIEHTGLAHCFYSVADKWPK